MILAVLLGVQSSFALDEPSPISVIDSAAHRISGSTTDSDDIHRILMGCQDVFVCPTFSDRKRGRSCYDSFDDCECVLGYQKKKNAYVAQEGLCSMEYVEMIQAKQEEAER